MLIAQDTRNEGCAQNNNQLFKGSVDLFSYHKRNLKKCFEFWVGIVIDDAGLLLKEKKDDVLWLISTLQRSTTNTCRVNDRGKKKQKKNKKN